LRQLLLDLDEALQRRGLSRGRFLGFGGGPGRLGEVCHQPCRLEHHGSVVGQCREQGDLVGGEVMRVAVGGEEGAEDLTVDDHRHSEERFHALGLHRRIDPPLVRQGREIVVGSPMGGAVGHDPAGQTDAGRHAQPFESGRDRAPTGLDPQIIGGRVVLGQIGDIAADERAGTIDELLQQLLRVPDADELGGAFEQRRTLPVLLLPPDHGRREVEEGVDELRLVAEPLGELGPVEIDSARERSHDLGHRCGRYVPDSILALGHGTSVSGVPWLRLGRPAPRSAGFAECRPPILSRPVSLRPPRSFLSRPRRSPTPQQSPAPRRSRARRAARRWSSRPAGNRTGRCRAARSPRSAPRPRAG
jgi:hypothetical protein